MDSTGQVDCATSQMDSTGEMNTATGGMDTTADQEVNSSIDILDLTAPNGHNAHNVTDEGVNVSSATDTVSHQVVAAAESQVVVPCDVENGGVSENQNITAISNVHSVKENKDLKDMQLSVNGESVLTVGEGCSNGVQNSTDLSQPENTISQTYDAKTQSQSSEVNGGQEVGGYRTVVISDSDTSADSESDSSSSSDSDSDQDVTENSEKMEQDDKENREKIHSDIISDEEISGPKKKDKSNKLFPRTKGELLPEELPPLDDLKITINPNIELVHIGAITSVVGVLAIIQSNKNIPPLDDDTILFLEGRVVLGQIFEVFGPVGHPWYSVRFNSEEDIHRQKITVGLNVYCAPRAEELTKYVFVEHLKMMKGSDASWEDNNEPPSQYLDYSDDEQERSAKSKNRRKKNNVQEEEDPNVLPGARVPKRRRNRDRNDKNDSTADASFQERNRGNNYQQKNHNWNGNHQNENGEYGNRNGHHGDPRQTNCYQTFQPFGRSPQFRPRMPMNRPPHRHQGPIRPPYFQPRNIRPAQPYWQSDGGNFSVDNRQNVSHNSLPNYENSNQRSGYAPNRVPQWSNRPNFGQHSFPGSSPRPFQNSSPNSNFTPSGAPSLNRLVDNRLIQNNNPTESQGYNMPPDFSVPPPGFSQS